MAQPNLPPPETPTEGWHDDPTERNELRYWKTEGWTEYVATRGDVGFDPPVPGPPVPTAQTKNAATVSAAKVDQRLVLIGAVGVILGALVPWVKLLDGSRVSGIETWAGIAVAAIGALIFLLGVLVLRWRNSIAIYVASAALGVLAAGIAIVVGADPVGFAKDAGVKAHGYLLAETAWGVYVVPVAAVFVAFGAIRRVNARSA
jgi:hypothetical protein